MRKRLCWTDMLREIHFLISNVNKFDQTIIFFFNSNIFCRTKPKDELNILFIEKRMKAY